MWGHQRPKIFSPVDLLPNAAAPLFIFYLHSSQVQWVLAHSPVVLLAGRSKAPPQVYINSPPLPADSPHLTLIGKREEELQRTFHWVAGDWGTEPRIFEFFFFLELVSFESQRRS